MINRSAPRGIELARQWNGRALEWDHSWKPLPRPIWWLAPRGPPSRSSRAQQFAQIERLRSGRPLFILDLAVPRDFEPAIGSRPGVYLYAIDDLREVCERNRAERDKELPLAMRIIDEETSRFVGELHHLAAAPSSNGSERGGRNPRTWNWSGFSNECRSSTRQPAIRSGSRLIGCLANSSSAAAVAAERVAPGYPSRPAGCVGDALSTQGLSPPSSRIRKDLSAMQIGKQRDSFIGLPEAGRCGASSPRGCACLGDLPGSRQGTGLRVVVRVRPTMVRRRAGLVGDEHSGRCGGAFPLEEESDPFCCDPCRSAGLAGRRKCETLVGGIDGVLALEEKETSDRIKLHDSSLFHVEWMAQQHQDDRLPAAFRFRPGPVDWSEDERLLFKELGGVRLKVLRFLAHARMDEDWIADPAGRGRRR